LPSRTPPDIKWLLVERATLVGDIARLERRQALLAAELAALRTTRDALDRTIAVLESRVRTDAAGSLKRHAPEYGSRGALKRFIVSTVSATKAEFTLQALTSQAEEHFQLMFATKEERTQFMRNSVRPQLQQLRREGLLQMLPAGRNQSTWRLRSNLPTFAELALLAGAAPPLGAPDGNKNEA
jgi:hypothetical protein